MERLQELTQWQIAVIAAIFASVCGCIKYLLRVEEGKIFKWHELGLQGLFSFVVGIISFEFVTYYSTIPTEVCGGIAGAAGFYATEITRLLTIVVCRKLSVKPEDIEK